MPIPAPTAEEIIENAPFRSITESVIAAGIEVHRHLGPGLTEPPYQEALIQELLARGHAVEAEVRVPLYYKGAQLRSHYRLDLVVDGIVIVELKASDGISDHARAQALSYLRATRMPVALVMNFAAPTLVKGLARILNWPIPRGPP